MNPFFCPRPAANLLHQHSIPIAHPEIKRNLVQMPGLPAKLLIADAGQHPVPEPPAANSIRREIADLL